MRQLAAVFFLLSATAASAADIDMEDPRRAVGREDDVRIDAQLVGDTIAPGVPIGVTVQIQNFTEVPVAVADKVASASYDVDTRTVTVSLGSEVPEANMPHVLLIAPGGKKTFRGSAVPSLTAAAVRSAFGAPRYVQVKVTILRDLAPFRALIDKQAEAPQPLPDSLFDRWFESSDTIILNAVPVYFKANGGNQSWDAENRDARGTF